MSQKERSSQTAKYVAMAIFWFVLVVAAFYIIQRSKFVSDSFHPKNNVPNQDSQSKQPIVTKEENNIKMPLSEAPNVNDYSGTYHNIDQSTGFETTVIITGNSYACQTINSVTNELIAKGSGILKGPDLIDQYGQHIGHIGDAYVSLSWGDAKIIARKK